MVVTIGGAKKKFADIVDELHTMPPMMSQFAVWLDMKLSEYKLQGDMRLDFHESVSAPDWMKGSKCQCMERAQYGQAPRHPNNAWMYSERESAMKMMDARLLSPKQLAQHRAEFGADDLDEFDDLNDPEQLDADMAIDAQHPLVQLLSKKSKKKPTGTGKRGRPRGGKGITVTSTGVRVKRVVAKRKEPDTFPDVPKTGRDPAGPQRQEKFPSAKPQPTSGDLHQTATPKIDPKDPAFAVKQEPNQEKPKASVFPTTLPPNLQRPPSIPDLSDDELLDAFNENDDDDDCSFDSATPPDSPDNRLDRPPHQGHPPGVPTNAPNIRQAFPGQNMPPSSSSQNFRPVPQGGQVPQGYFRGAFPPQREAISTNPSQSPRQVTAPHTQTQFSQAQQQQHHQGNQPQHPAQQHQTNLGQPHTSQQQGSTPQGTPHPASSHPNSQSTPHSAASGAPALPPGHNFSQSSQSPGGTGLRLERYRQPLTTPQSLMRTPDLEDEDFMDTMDSFNDDFYDDDFGTGTDNEDIISLVSDEEAAHLAILTGSVGSPSESVPETASLPEQLSGSQPGDKSTRPVVSDPGMAGNQEDGSAPKKRKYNRKSDAIKVPKDVRLTVHNVVRDLKTQNSNLEWDFTKGLTDEWNREMNSKIVALVENRIGKVDVDTCMKAINCYYVSRKAQWRKQQGGSTEDVKKKPKSAPKAEQTDSSQTPPTQSKPPTPQP